jgi:hypothetical protein
MDRYEPSGRQAGLAGKECLNSVHGRFIITTIVHFVPGMPAGTDVRPLFGRCGNSGLKKIIASRAQGPENTGA